METARVNALTTTMLMLMIIGIRTRTKCHFRMLSGSIPRGQGWAQVVLGEVEQVPMQATIIHTLSTSTYVFPE